MRKHNFAYPERRYTFKVWCEFANDWCRKRRQLDLSVNHNALMLAIRREFGPSWDACYRFSERYAAAWLLREERRTHKSMRETVQ